MEKIQKARVFLYLIQHSDWPTTVNLQNGSQTSDMEGKWVTHCTTSPEVRIRISSIKQALSVKNFSSEAKVSHNTCHVLSYTVPHHTCKSIYKLKLQTVCIIIV